MIAAAVADLCMLIGLQTVDYGVLALYLALMLLVGGYFSREQHSSRDFFLAGQAMTWFPIGLSVMATLLSALSYSGIPGEAYHVGVKHLLLPTAAWFALPLMFWVVLPLYRGLGLYSIYEYLELRFGVATRLLSSLVFVGWRLLWLGGVLYAPCKVLIIAAGLTIPEWLLLSLLGLVGTLYTYLGGMKAVIWTDVIQALVMVSGVLLIVGGVWLRLDDGPAEVWQVAERLGRSELVDLRFDWAERWAFWGIAPHFVLSMLSFYVADQITAQRFLTVKDVREARRSFVLNCISVSVMIPALTYVGMCLLAFYQQHPDQIRPIWVVNVDPERRDAVTGADGAPLIDWEQGRLLDGQVEPERIRKLVDQGRLLRPNTKEPFADPSLVLNDAQQLRPDRLAVSKNGEWVLNRRAQDELLPRFITRQLPVGIAGLILAALFAASMSSMDSGLNSVCTLIITDVYRRMGWGRRWLARRRRKPIEALDEADEIRLARPLVLGIGIAATVFSLFVGQMGSIFDIMVGIVNTFGGPLLAVFLLGMLTRHTTGAAALAALASGMLFTVWLLAVNRGWGPLGEFALASNRLALLLLGVYCLLVAVYPVVFLARRYRLGRPATVISAAVVAAGVAGGLVWCWQAMAAPERVNNIWLIVFSVAFTSVVGYGLSWIVGRKPTLQQLQGLVVGVGRLGERDPATRESRGIHIAQPSTRWR